MQILIRKKKPASCTVKNAEQCHMNKDLQECTPIVGKSTPHERSIYLGLI